MKRKNLKKVVGSALCRVGLHRWIEERFPRSGYLARHCDRCGEGETWKLGRAGVLPGRWEKM